MELKDAEGRGAFGTLPSSMCQLALEQVSDAILLLHRPLSASEPRVQFVNEDVERVTGYDASELIGSPISILAGRDTDPAIFETFYDTLKVGETSKLRVLLYRKDVSAYWADVSIRRLDDHPEGGSVYLVVNHDVDAEVRLQVFVDMGVDMISRHDAFGTYLSVSPACKALMGYSQEELLGRRSAEFIHPEDLRQFTKFETLADVYELRYRMLCKGGQSKWVESRSRIVRNPADAADVYEVHAITRDITGQLKGERELRDSADRYRELFEANPSPAWIYDPETYEILAVNRQAVAHYGYTKEEFAAISLLDIRPPEDVARLVRDMRLRTETTHDHGEWRHRRRDGSIIEVRVVSSMVDWEGRNARLAIIRDVTAENSAKRELMNYREQLERSQSALEAAQTVAHIGSWDLDVPSNHVVWTDELYRIYGLTREEFPPIPGSLWQFDHPSDVAEVRRQYEEAFAGGRSYDMVHRLKRKDGSIRWVHEIGKFHYDANGVALREVGTIQDITDRKIAEDKLAFLAHFDALTRLPNRVLLRDRLQQAVYQAKRDGAFVAVAFFDLDRFKNINDSLGHRYGDLLLKKVAKRLSGGLRDGDTVCRYSGDEFIIVLGGFKVLADVGATMQRIMAKLAPSFRLAGKNYQMSASAGVSVYPADGRDLETLVKHADVAMYQAKTDGRGEFRFYSPEMQEAVDQRLALGAELHMALERQEFRLVYQPIIELATGRIISAEALLRWDHPRQGLRQPLEFISILEETGLIVPIGGWVIHQACADAATWQREGCETISVAVNVSPVQFRSPQLEAHVTEALRDSGIRAESLDIEITESLLMDHDRTLDVASRLAALGARLVLDDFGTGFSSLGTLGRFPIRGLKIDRSFVDRIEFDGQARTISRTIVSLAQSLNLMTVAEGIENQPQLTILQQLGCTIGQGYFLHKPMPESDFRRLLTRQRALVG